MENLIKLNFCSFQTAKEVKDAILDWTDRDLKDEIQMKRFDILTLISTHHLMSCTEMSYDNEFGLYSIKIKVPAHSFYGISCFWVLEFQTSEFGDVISFDVKKLYDKDYQSKDLKLYLHNELQQATVI
ncbi:hypothetical protein DLAC_10453 [Tieghemostelium lacteum]|uniref:Uncharacterized protein n=1 Tax=Tieghemostelium lacteum TaxID=361077 RepID=A0A151Z5G1_TIELA|nr:hypothetical protein DLAC_10453 [Tieghemostelium lacteum]|eukprot:KYQ89209.1 hypothetical protein DLAC_10453 [Tieghemostelium lacteum]